MATISHPNTISAFASYMPEAMQCTVRFTWDTAQPTDTYTIDCYDAAIELDKHNIARPSALYWHAGSSLETETCIVQGFGAELAKDMAAMITEGTFAIKSLTVELDKQKRLFIARKQLLSASTPLRLRGMLELFTKENQHHEDEPLEHRDM